MASSFVALLVTICQLHSLVSAFYSDNGDQTVFMPKISKRERREMQQEILSLLGLDHRPKPPASVATDTSAPRYMLDLYKNLIDTETGELIANESTRIDPKLWHDDNSLHAIYDADIIMSFVNHGRHRRRRCRKVSNPLRLKSQTNRPVCIPRNATNDRPAHEKAHLRHDKDRRFWFDMSEVPVGETLIGCELRLYKELGLPSKKSHFHNDLEADTNFTLSIYEIVKAHDPDDKELKLVDSVNITYDYEGWVYLNVSDPANNWLAFPESNLGLFLRIHVEGKAKELHPKEINLVGNKGRHDHQPFMVAFFKMTQGLHIRRTRAAKQRQRTDISYNDADTWTGYSANPGMDLEAINKRSCQKRILFVSFKELGWQDWIIAPDGYAAFYCSGECSFPLNAHMNATNHAIVQTLVHLMNPFDVPKPCCAPTKLSAISVLFFDDNSNVILKKYKNMVVKSCGCH